MGFELLIFLISPIINAWWDSAHGELHHFRSWLIRGAAIIGISLGLSFIIPNSWPYIVDTMFWLYLSIGIATEFLLFDYLYNWFTGNDWDYIGAEEWHKDDWTWKIYKKMQSAPEIVLTIKVFLFVTTLAIYYQLDRF